MLDVLRAYGVKAVAEVIPTGLQEHSFKEADGEAFRIKYGIPLNRPALLFVGRVAFEKNIGFLLEMTKLLITKQPDVMLVVAGQGPAEKHLHQLATDLGLDQHIKFIGYLDRKTELNACYQAADIFVFSSKSETQGLVLLEAMAQGTPVVAISELGTASILREGEGALIAPDDTQGFADRVHHLLQYPEERYELGKQALIYAQENWTARLQAERMLNFYQQLKATYQQKVEKKQFPASSAESKAVNVEF